MVSYRRFSHVPRAAVYTVFCYDGQLTQSQPHTNYAAVLLYVHQTKGDILLFLLLIPDPAAGQFSLDTVFICSIPAIDN